MANLSEHPQEEINAREGFLSSIGLGSDASDAEIEKQVSEIELQSREESDKLADGIIREDWAQLQREWERRRAISGRNEIKEERVPAEQGRTEKGIAPRQPEERNPAEHSSNQIRNVDQLEVGRRYCIHITSELEQGSHNTVEVVVAGKPYQTSYGSWQVPLKTDDGTHYDISCFFMGITSFNGQWDEDDWTEPLPPKKETK